MSIVSMCIFGCYYIRSIGKAGGTPLNFATIHWLLLKRCSNKSIALLNLQIWWTPSAFSHLKKLLPQSPVSCCMQKHWILTVKLTYSAHTNLFQPSFSHQKALNMLVMYNLVGGAHGAVHCATIYWYEYGFCLIHTPTLETKYTICAGYEKRCARKNLRSVYISLCILHIIAYIERVRKSEWSLPFAWCNDVCTVNVCMRTCVCVCVYERERVCVYWFPFSNFYGIFTRHTTKNMWFSRWTIEQKP